MIDTAHGHSAKVLKVLSKLKKISKQAAEDARLRFTPELTAGAYAKVLKEVMKQPILDISPLSWNQFKPDVNFKQKGD